MTTTIKDFDINGQFIPSTSRDLSTLLSSNPLTLPSPGTLQPEDYHHGTPGCYSITASDDDRQFKESQDLLPCWGRVMLAGFRCRHLAMSSHDCR